MPYAYRDAPVGLLSLWTPRYRTGSAFDIVSRYSRESPTKRVDLEISEIQKNPPHGLEQHSNICKSTIPLALETVQSSHFCILGQKSLLATVCVLLLRCFTALDI